MIESVSPPEILVHGIVTPDDVEKLFKMCVVLQSADLGVWSRR